MNFSKLNSKVALIKFDFWRGVDSYQSVYNIRNPFKINRTAPSELHYEFEPHRENFLPVIKDRDRARFRFLFIYRL
jgi:hypothetical protein